MFTTVLAGDLLPDLALFFVYRSFYGMRIEATVSEAASTAGSKG